MLKSGADGILQEAAEGTEAFLATDCADVQGRILAESAESEFLTTKNLARRSRDQSNGVETQSAQRLRSRAQRNASASVTSFELHVLCDEKSCLENKIQRVCNTEVEPELIEREQIQSGFDRASWLSGLRLLALFFLSGRRRRLVPTNPAKHAPADVLQRQDSPNETGDDQLHQKQPGARIYVRQN
jgi:hypothetical protein